MPKYFALILAPLPGSLAGTIFLVAWYGNLGVVGLGLFVVTAAYTYTAIVCVPLIYVLPRFRALTPLAVYVAVALGTVPLAIWFLSAAPLHEFAICTVIVGVISAIAFNAMFFRRVAL
jgi:hypothetical protein